MTNWDLNRIDRYRVQMTNYPSRRRSWTIQRALQHTSFLHLANITTTHSTACSGQTTGTCPKERTQRAVCLNESANAEQQSHQALNPSKECTGSAWAVPQHTEKTVSTWTGAEQNCFSTASLFMCIAQRSLQIPTLLQQCSSMAIQPCALQFKSQCKNT
jgi:hypothetical protein